MPKRLLLVDDEKFLLESLQEGLLDYNNLFDTKICFSADEAIELTKKFRFDLIITDIRMPGKSGVDLFMHLKENDFQGKVMAMTAYGNEEIFTKINDLGAMKIIIKPFDFEWFKKLLINFFSELKGFSGTIESIDLTSVLQIINLEKKTVVVKIIINDKSGYLYFSNGDIINAEFDGLTGIEAAKKLINLNRGKFSVLKGDKKIKRNIDIPFITFIINIAKELDEKKYKKNKKLHATEKKIDIGVSKQIFQPLKEISGLKGAGIFNSEGFLISEESRTSVNLKGLGVFGLNLYESTIETFRQLKLGRFDLFQVETDKFIYLFAWLIPEEIYMGIILDLKGNIGILKHKIKEITNSIDKYVIL
jgi:CheY-like chemotaxis protein/predicted regulator of Ras-like GTPase activity (Roadblock/LC7/MglB family)